MFKSLVIVLSSLLLLSACVETQEQIEIVQPLPVKGTAEYQELINPSGSMAENITKVNTIYEITSNLLAERNLEEAKYLAENQLKISLLIEYKRGEGLAYNTLAIVSRRRGDTKSALENQLKAYSIWELTNDVIGTAKSSINLGNLYRDNSLFSDAVSYYKQAIQILKENDGELRLIRVATANLAEAYELEKDYSMAESLYKEALDLAVSESNQLAINSLYNDLGLTYMYKGDLELAKTYFLRYLELSISSDNEYAVGIAYNNLGLVSSKLNDLDQAKSYLNKAIDLTTDPVPLARALQNLSDVHLKENELNKSLTALLKAEGYNSELGVQEVSVSTTEELANVYEKLGNTAQALKYRKLLDEQQRQLKDTEHKLVLQAAKDFKEVEVRYASFTSSLLVDAMQSKYFGYFIAALFLVLAVFVTSFYSSVYKMWRA